MPAFDTSAIVPLFDRAHPNGEAARKRFAEAKEVLLHPCVLAEATRVLRRLANRAGSDGNAAARTALKALLAEPRCRFVSETDHDRAVQCFLDAPSLSYTDAVVASMGADAVAFDDRLLAAAKA